MAKRYGAAEISSPIAQRIEFDCSGRQNLAGVANRLMHLAGGAPAEVRDIRANHNYFAYCTFGVSQDNPGALVTWNQGIHVSGGYWNGTAWAPVLGGFLGWQGGPNVGANAQASYVLDGADGVIQIRQSTHANGQYLYAWAKVLIIGAPYDVANFPTGTPHLP